MSPQTLADKCHELAQRLEWPAETVTWRKGRDRGVEIRLRRKLPGQEVIPHFQRTFPAMGQIRFRADQSRGCCFHILDLQVDEEEPSGSVAEEPSQTTANNS